MQQRTFTRQELARMIMNEDNPKTMDYFFMKLLNVQVVDAKIGWDGRINGAIRNMKGRISEAFGVLGRIRSYVRGQIYFVMDIHEHQIFPKSRSFRICSRKIMPISIINPNDGKTKTITYGGGYTTNYLEPLELLESKQLVLYCRNAWERKGEVKPSRAKTEAANTAETIATEEAVSVI